MPKSKCRWKWKVAHPTKAAAQRHAADLRRKGGRQEHVYPCPAGHWHVGSAGTYRAKVRRNPADKRQRGKRRFGKA